MEDLKPEERCGDVHPDKGVCVREKDHVGLHTGEGENIPGGLNGVQGKKYQTWTKTRSSAT